MACRTPSRARERRARRSSPQPLDRTARCSPKRRRFSNCGDTAITWRPTRAWFPPTCGRSSPPCSENILLNWFVLIPRTARPRWTVPSTHGHRRRVDGQPRWGRGDCSRRASCCASWTIAYASLQRIRYIEQRPRQGTVLVLAVLPICFAAVCLTIGWAWLAQPAPAADARPSSWIFSIVPFGVATMVAGVARLYGRHGDRPQDRRSRSAARRPAKRLGELIVYVFIGGVGAILMRVGRVLVRLAAHRSPRDRHVFDGRAPRCFLLSFALAAGCFAGLASALMTEEDREWWSRFGAWLLMVSLAWTLAGAVVLFVPHWIAEGLTLLIASAATIGSGAVTILGGLSKRTVMNPALGGGGGIRGRREPLAVARRQDRAARIRGPVRRVAGAADRPHRVCRDGSPVYPRCIRRPVPSQ